MTIRRLPTADLTPADLDAIKEILLAAFAEDEHGGFTEEDWQHSIGGTHFIAEVDGTIVAHASVVHRTLFADGVPLRTGYVEAVAALPAHQRQGHGSALMRAVNDLIRTDYELGALGTGSQPFYERLGWQVWRGPSCVRTATGDTATPDEDGYIMVLMLPSTPPLRPDAPIVCEWRPGDVW